jgi:hypothetical protein
MGLVAVNAGNNTAGAINAFLTLDPPVWTTYPDGQN